MHFQSHVPTTSVHKLLFADDCSLNATSEGDRQRSLDLFAAARDIFGLVINTGKTVAMHQPPPDASQINLDGTQIQAVDNVTFLTASFLTAPKSAMKWPAEFPMPAELRSLAGHRLDSSRSPPQRQTQGVQSSHLADAAVWSGNLHGLQEADAKGQPLPPRLTSTDAKAEMAGSHFGHSHTGTDKNPQHHAMATQLHLRWGGCLVRMDDGRLPKRLFH
nr:unnamed protein product [Spirometra erinaceieuropaei]